MTFVKYFSCSLYSVFQGDKISTILELYLKRQQRRRYIIVNIFTDYYTKCLFQSKFKIKHENELGYHWYFPVGTAIVFWGRFFLNKNGYPVACLNV